MSELKWKINLTNINIGIFKPMNGTADEMIGIGRIIKSGFLCSKVDVPNAKYDALVENTQSTKFIRVQIKGTSTGSLSFLGGYRSGKQIDRSVPKRDYKYTNKDCDLFLGVNSHNGECYIIPTEDLKKWGNTKSLSQLSEYKENWEILKKLAS